MDAGVLTSGMTFGKVPGRPSREGSTEPVAALTLLPLRLAAEQTVGCTTAGRPRAVRHRRPRLVERERVGSGTAALARLMEAAMGEGCATGGRVRDFTT